ncbi:large subunit ribosomal protein L25 [Caminicella sporogenes DSM 14501]|uniref:Large ribosomal subunit protein bL25 n=1 Tax=Caminicella sporogenes DSM 14501 TaxID=1121266 RepID=A0A1M6SB90_9FIRM|nr:50S ribosomal protein L25 [Caminicella sporogenes]RKD26939.1 hypothetical protein BET04_10040 [Caminicella sporogenes]SHK41960.1 large subunit ribosomal protein L25 [Caminicella sporogenes DSM 14501]
MLKAVVNADIRSNVGSNESNRMRNSGYIPAVLYGYNVESRNIKIDKKEFNNILRSYGTNTLLNLKIDGEVIISMIKEIQKDSIDNNILHVDFQAVSNDKPIHVTVPLKLVDKEFIRSNHTAIQQQLRELNIECLPKNIPQSIEISVKDLVLGHPITIGDLEFSEEITVLHESSQVVASLTHGERVIDDEREENLQDITYE